MPLRTLQENSTHVSGIQESNAPTEIKQCDKEGNVRKARLQRPGKTISSGRPLRTEEMPTFYDYVQCLDKCSTNWQLRDPAPRRSVPTPFRSLFLPCVISIEQSSSHYIVDFSQMKIRARNVWRKRTSDSE